MNHVEMSRHVLANASTREAGIKITDRMYRVILARYSWAQYPPSTTEVNQAIVNRVLDAYPPDYVKLCVANRMHRPGPGVRSPYTDPDA